MQLFSTKKLHPVPGRLMCTPASVNEPNGFRQSFGDIFHDRIIFSDNGYCDNDLETLKENDNLILLTPDKLVKEETEEIRL